MSETEEMLHSELRTGNTQPGAKAVAYLRRMKRKIPPEVQNVYLRSDSAFYNKRVVHYCEGEGWTFSITADQTAPLRQVIENVAEEGWKEDRSSRATSSRTRSWTSSCTYRNDRDRDVFLKAFARGRFASAVKSFEAAVARQGAVLNSQMARVQHDLSSRVRYAWLHDLLEAEVASVLHFGPRGQAVLPKVTYAIDDHWKVVAGGEIYRGEGTAQFGMMRLNSVAFGELRLAF